MFCGKCGAVDGEEEEGSGIRTMDKSAHLTGRVLTHTMTCNTVDERDKQDPTHLHAAEDRLEYYPSLTTRQMEGGCTEAVLACSIQHDQNPQRVSASLTCFSSCANSGYPVGPTVKDPSPSCSPIY